MAVNIEFDNYSRLMDGLATVLLNVPNSTQIYSDLLDFINGPPISTMFSDLQSLDGIKSIIHSKLKEKNQEMWKLIAVLDQACVYSDVSSQDLLSALKHMYSINLLTLLDVATSAQQTQDLLRNLVKEELWIVVIWLLQYVQPYINERARITNVRSPITT